MSTYLVSEILRTIQGEGWWAGLPCTLVRFQGCNLRCPFCDTDYALEATSGEKMNLFQLFERISEVHPTGQVILLTGGEPTLQPLAPLVSVISPLGPVHLETNGTQSLHGNTMYRWITVSPKTAWCGKAATVAKSAIGRADEIKWLIGTEDDIGKLQEFLEEVKELGFFDGPFKRVTLQPIWGVPKAHEIAFRACLEHGWRLSLQMHKYLGKP